MLTRREWKAALRGLQIALIVAVFALDFLHGIRLGERDIGFHPIYRFRQTLAVALSRLHHPAMHGYLADQSVIDALDEAGFPRLPEEGGPRDQASWTAYFSDSAALDRAMERGLKVTFDPALPPQIIKGNEVAYADYFVLAFRLFGLHMSSLYYFFFLILGASCVLFYIEFRSSSFLLFLLTTYLGGIYFLQNYVNSQNPIWGATLANSRFFEALTLLPATHIFLVAWRRREVRLATAAAVVLQALILAFLIDCRITARWQVAAICGAAVFAIRWGKWKNRKWLPALDRNVWNAAWPALVAVSALGLHMAAINYSVDSRYADESKYHIIWHEVLRGLLGSSVELQRVYLGHPTGLGAASDKDSYDAIDYELNQHHDLSSPIAVVERGMIRVDVTKGWGEYERLARNLVLKMVREHPLAVLSSLYNKGVEQVFEYRVRGAMSLQNLKVAIVICVIGALIWLGLQSIDEVQLIDGAMATSVLLIFALAPPVIAPSPLSVGTLLAYLMGFILAVLTFVVLILRRLVGHRS